jgi:hypothetical protein
VFSSMRGKHGIIFLILDFIFLAYQSLRNVGSQIEIKMIFIFFSRHTYKPKRDLDYKMLVTIRQFREIHF